MTPAKPCPKCERLLPVTRFHNNRRRRDGLALWCKDCVADYSKAYNQREDVKERAAAAALARYHRLSVDEKLRMQQRRYQLASHLLKKYGLTIEGYEALLSEQGGVCAICERPPKEGRRLAVDHDHACCPGDTSCGECVRGLLCTTCNTWLGFYENEEWVEGADAYLERG